MKTPLLVGICGGTGSGKTSLVHRMEQALTQGKVSILQQDMYYRDLSSIDLSAREATNFDHPDAVDAPLLASHLRTLKQLHPVQAPVYDFVTHTRTEQTVLILPRPLILVEGTLIFSWSEVRNLFDLRIFLEADPGIRFARRLARDVQERGRTLQSVEQQFRSTVRPMHEQFVEPSRDFAHLQLRTDRSEGLAVEILINGLRTLL